MTAQGDAALGSAARIQALSLVLRAGQPVLLAYATRVHGLAALGAFLAAQAAVFVVARVALLGLDRALLVTAPRLARDGHGVPLGRAARVVVLAALAGAAPIALFLCASQRVSPTYVAVASLSAIPVALVELSASVAIARGRFTTVTLVRDTLAPTLSVALVLLPVWPRGDALAFLAPFSLVAVATALVLGAPAFADAAIDRRGDAPLPDRVVRVARGALVADGVATLSQRLDVVVLALVASPTLVGTYGVLAQFAQTLRAMRTGIEPVVQKRVAESDAVTKAGARPALRAALRATLSLQLPVALVFVLFRMPLLAFFGVHGAAPGLALVVMTLGHVLATGLAFEVAVLHGRGRGLAVAWALSLGAATQAALFFALVPTYGLVGAAWASAIAVIVPGVVGATLRRAHERARHPFPEAQEVRP